MSKQAVRNRRQKVELDLVKPCTKEKFIKAALEIETQEMAPVPRLEAKNANQKLAMAMLREGRKVIFLAGSSGTGKSLIAAHYAATQLKAKKADQVFLIRPAITTGKSLGSLPGDEKMKLAPYFVQTLTHLAKFMGAGYLKYCVEKDIVQTQSSEYLRGRSFENCIVVCEEGQNYTADEFEMVLTRLGEGCTMIFTGDFKQHDLRGVSGLETTIDLLMRMENEQPEYLTEEDLDEMTENIGIVRFTPDDVVRSGLTKAFVKMYYNN